MSLTQSITTAAIRIDRRAEPTLTKVPLTTIFTPAIGCFDGSYGLENNGKIAFQDYNAAAVSCWPPSYAALELFQTFGWYSPGVCPVYYTTAHQELLSNDGKVTTLAWCCLSGLTITSDAPPGTQRVCRSYVSKATLVNLPGGDTSQITSDFYACRWPVSVQWAASDLAKFTPKNAPVSASASFSTSSFQSESTMAKTGRSSIITSLYSAPTSSNNAATSSSRSTLSTGAQAGIGAGVSVAVFLLLSVVAWIIIRRHRGKSQKSADDQKAANVSHHSPAEKREGERHEIEPIKNPEVELDGTPQAELEDVNKPPESGRRGMHELLGCPTKQEQL